MWPFQTNAPTRLPRRRITNGDIATCSHQRTHNSLAANYIDCSVGSETLGDGAEIEQHAWIERHCGTCAVESHIPPAPQRLRLLELLSSRKHARVAGLAPQSDRGRGSDIKRAATRLR